MGAIDNGRVSRTRFVRLFMLPSFHPQTKDISVTMHESWAAACFVIVFIFAEAGKHVIRQRGSSDQILLGDVITTIEVRVLCICMQGNFMQV